MHLERGFPEKGIMIGMIEDIGKVNRSTIPSYRFGKNVLWDLRREWKTIMKFRVQGANYFD